MTLTAWAGTSRNQTGTLSHPGSFTNYDALRTHFNNSPSPRAPSGYNIGTDASRKTPFLLSMPMAAALLRNGRIHTGSPPSSFTCDFIEPWTSNDAGQVTATVCRKMNTGSSSKPMATEFSSDCWAIVASSRPFSQATRALKLGS